MEGSQDALILMELKKISKLLVLNLNHVGSQNDLILAMTKVGLQPREIADLLGTTPNTVKVARSVAKSKAKSKSRKPGGNNDQQGTSEETA